ncbi:hypothetical protein HNP84_008903 [Thermocatellispora tengchongensis]|uniref:Uncharacterized protein n=1 Tax=Thermocatellispora tengchongensis TaxID=1073253 RepID=A0A840PN70_9ACTN|nr:hypothetical protein [Thermocatellispora tengchongensis]MBB5139140.1 hypothetical protein [Thermocatellispora tengchongensis]
MTSAHVPRDERRPRRAARPAVHDFSPEWGVADRPGGGEALIAFDDVVRWCEDLLADHDGPHSMVYVRQGFAVLGLDVFDHERCPVKPHDGLRQAHIDAARQLVAQIERFDLTLTALRTGELMRTVVEGPESLVFCGRVRPGEYLVAVRYLPAGLPDGDAATATDRELSLLMTDIRMEVFGQPDEHPGGDPGGELPPVDPGWELRISEGAPGWGRALAESALHPLDLHYLACYRDWRHVFDADRFDHPLAAARPGRLSPAARRERYAEAASRTRREMSLLAQTLWPVTSSGVRRIVLDVQEGALYAQMLPARGTFVFGVTTEQRAVRRAERRLTEAAARVPAS